MQGNVHRRNKNDRSTQIIQYKNRINLINAEWIKSMLLRLDMAHHFQRTHFCPFFISYNYCARSSRELFYLLEPIVGNAHSRTCSNKTYRNPTTHINKIQISYYEYIKSCINQPCTHIPIQPFSIHTLPSPSNLPNHSLNSPTHSPIHPQATFMRPSYAICTRMLLGVRDGVTVPELFSGCMRR